LTLILLQLLRMAALVAVCLGWYRAIQLGRGCDPEQRHAQPGGLECMGHLPLAGHFCPLGAAELDFFHRPLARDARRHRRLRSLARSLRLGALTGKLVEVNLVLGIVRLALIVLAMVFSAIPLPFEADMTGTALYLHGGRLVTLLYLVASDFFQVARLAAFVQFWRLYHPDPAANSVY
jgi:hypothetical protein